MRNKLSTKKPRSKISLISLTTLKKISPPHSNSHQVQSLHHFPLPIPIFPPYLRLQPRRRTEVTQLTIATQYIFRAIIWPHATLHTAARKILQVSIFFNLSQRPLGQSCLDRHNSWSKLFDPGPDLFLLKFYWVKCLPQNFQWKACTIWPLQGSMGHLRLGSSKAEAKTIQICSIDRTLDSKRGWLRQDKLSPSWNVFIRILESYFQSMLGW